jgi:hypothetical protein
MPEIDYEKYLVRKPLYETPSGFKNRQSPTMTLMSSTQVPEANYYVELGWIYDIPEPNPHIHEHAHNYNEVVLHFGGDPQNPEDLGGEIEFYVGDKPLIFNTNTAVYLPAGVPHGPLTWKKFTKPHIEMAMMLGTGNIKEGWADSGIKDAKEKLPQKTGDIDYERYLVRKPIYEVGGGIKNRQSPTMTYMSNDLVPGCNMYLELGWIYDMPEPNPHIFEHSHEYDEIVLHIGGDPNNPEDLGAEIEFCVGGKPLTFDTSSGLFAPKGVKHGPLTWKKFSKPHIQMAIILGAGTMAQASPAGYEIK